MHRRIIISILLISLLIMVGCQQPTISGIEYSLAEGSFWHDINLTNKSGKDLHEVKMTLTLIGEKGEPRSENRYYVVWPNGQTINVSLSVENSPINVQKISLAGSCTEGSIDSTWIPSKPAGKGRPAQGT